jgi:hypothetical protein
VVTVNAEQANIIESLIGLFGAALGEVIEAEVVSKDDSQKHSYPAVLLCCSSEDSGAQFRAEISPSGRVLGLQFREQPRANWASVECDLSTLFNVVPRKTTKKGVKL